MHRDRRGAAMVEFIVILVPLMTLFLAMLELSRLAIAHLLLQRAAGMAVRACAVIKDQPKNCDPSAAGPAPGSPGVSAADGLIQRAASEGLRPWTDASLSLDAVECRTTKPSGEDALKIQARFRCIVPIAKNLLCSSAPGSTSSSRGLTATARYAHQGANYNCDYASMEYALPGASGPIDLPALGGAWP